MKSTAGEGCHQYLAVEGDALGNTNDDCGGRKPGYDVIEATYSLLAFGIPSGADDGVTLDDAPAAQADDVFP